MPYRFDKGTSVLCRVGDQQWCAGKIVSHDYREDDWAPGKKVPYQIALDDGRLIFSPVDDDELVRLLVVPWWGKLFSERPGSYFARNPQATGENDLREACGKNGDVNERDHEGTSALLRAAHVNWKNGVAQLLQMNADPNLASNDQTVPLHVATIYGVAMVRALIEGRADPNRQDIDPEHDPDVTSKTFGKRLQHRTPLHYACVEDNAEAVSLLIESGAKLDVQDAQCKTPLHLAIDEERAGIIEILLRSQADVNLGNLEDGMQTSPLITASKNGRSDLVVALIGARANVDQQGKQGMTALHMAARGGHAAIVKTLLASDADIELKNEAGSTAVQLAQVNRNNELLHLFGADASFQQPPAEREVKHISALDAAQKASLCLE